MTAIKQEYYCGIVLWSRGACMGVGHNTYGLYVCISCHKVNSYKFLAQFHKIKTKHTNRSNDNIKVHLNIANIYRVKIFDTLIDIVKVCGRLYERSYVMFHLIKLREAVQSNASQTMPMCYRFNS